MHKDLKSLIKAMVKLTLNRAKALKDVKPIVIEKEKVKRKRPKDNLLIVNGEVVGECNKIAYNQWDLDGNDSDSGSSPDCKDNGPEKL